MKTKSPAFQFYYKEWLTGTMNMTRVERDIYLTLLIYSFDLNGLPTEEQELFRLAICKTKAEKEALRYVLKKFVDKDGKYVNLKMENVRQDQIEFKKSKSDSGKVGAKKRWQKDGTAIVSPMANDSSTTTTASTTANTNQQQHAHEVFADKIFSEEGKLDKEQLEISLAVRREITVADVRQFNAHLHTEGKNHVHFSQWKSHLRNWLNTRPSGNLGQNPSKNGSPKNNSAEMLLRQNQSVKEQLGINEN